MLNPSQRIVVIVLLAGGSIAVCSGVAALGLRTWLDPFDDQPFTPAAWAQGGSSEGRGSMARDLVRYHLPDGMQESQVVALLGPPDAILTRQDAGGNALRGARTYSYHIGHWSLRGLDDAFVYVHLNGSGRVVHVEINGY